MGYFKDLVEKLFGGKVESGDWAIIDKSYFKGEKSESFTEGIPYRVAKVRVTPEGKEQVYLIDNKGNPTPVGKRLVHKVKEKDK